MQTFRDAKRIAWETTFPQHEHESRITDYGLLITDY
jgi:hypothetical protein